MKTKLVRPILKGLLASAGLMAIYFGLLTLLSGWQFTWIQFSQYWYYIVVLAFGFGIQITLFFYLKALVHQRKVSGALLITTGSTSTLAMISCCTHYLINILPVLGVTGLITFVAQYQTELFWVGIFFNLLGILYMASKIYRFKILIVASIFLLASCQSQKVPETLPEAVPEVPMYSSQSDDQKMVTVIVQPLNIKEGNSMDFEITLQTHSVELTVDLMTNTVLIDDKGTEYKPLFWTGDEPGGHHRSGILTFNSVKSSSIELKITNVAGEDERFFQWTINNSNQ